MEKQEKALLTIIVPAYNVEAYIEECLNSLVNQTVRNHKIIIVNDGSTDKTEEKCLKYKEEYEELITYVYQDNKGLGGARNTGMQYVDTPYLTFLDSDDWFNSTDFVKFVNRLKSEDADLVVCDYRKEHTYNSKSEYFVYKNLEDRKCYCFDDIDLKILEGEYFVMATSTYKTEILRTSGLKMLEKTFYVDMQYNVVPMTKVETFTYYHLDIYRYFIGRDDQSVNEKVMISRIDQQINVNKIMVDEFDLWKIPNRKLRHYMFNYLEIITVISTIMLIRSGTEENLLKKRELWKYIKDHDIRLFHHLRAGIMGNAMNLPGKGGRKISVAAYRLSQKVVGFN